MVPGSDTEGDADAAHAAEAGETAGPSAGVRRKLRELARAAAAIRPEEDAKLALLVRELCALLDEGYRPIVFCRFIETAHYVTDHLREALERSGAWKGRTVIECVTGELSPEDRKGRIEGLSSELTGNKVPVLVATDCLSEGVNLQDRFTAVVHYDLSWNPTRHEQREGRVDRFGQRARTVKALTIYGADNPIDGIVLDVLIRKHKLIKTDTGVAIPVPMDSNDVLSAIMEGFDFRSAWKGKSGTSQLEFDMGQEFLVARERLHRDWENAALRDRETRTRFAQRSVKPDEVARELSALREAAGGPEAVRWFFESAIRRLGGSAERVQAAPLPAEAVTTAAAPAVSGTAGAAGGAGEPRGEILKAGPAGMPTHIRELVFPAGDRLFGFDDLAPAGAEILARSHPAVSALASFVLEGALEGKAEGKYPAASRAGAVRTKDVRTRTVLMVARFRFDIRTVWAGRKSEDLCEETGAVAYRQTPAGASGGPGFEPVPAGEIERLFAAAPTSNVPPELAAEAVRRELERGDFWRPLLEEEGKRRAEEHAVSFERLRTAVRMRRGEVSVSPRGEADILGIYVYLPAGVTT